MLCYVFVYTLFSYLSYRFVPLKIPFYKVSLSKSIYFMLLLVCLIYFRSYYGYRLLLPLMLVAGLNINRTFLKVILVIPMYVILMLGYSKLYIFTSSIVILFIFLGEMSFRQIKSVRAIITGVVLLITIFVSFRQKFEQKFATIISDDYKIMGLDTYFLWDEVDSLYNWGELSFKSIYGVLVNPIPRSLWSGKPVAFGVELAARIWNTDIYNIPTNYGVGIVLEALVNGGLLGLLIFGFISGQTLRLLENTCQIFGVPRIYWLLFVVLFVRGDFLNAMVNIILSLIVIYSFARIKKVSAHV